MKTAIENTPKALFQTKEQYLKFIQSWKENYKKDKEQFVSTHFLIYSIFRNKDWRKCFTPCTNKNKLNSGQKQYYSAFNSFFNLKRSTRYLDIFNGTITSEMLDKALKDYLPNTTEFNLGNSIPSQAYKTITPMKEVA